MRRRDEDAIGCVGCLSLLIVVLLFAYFDPMVVVGVLLACMILGVIVAVCSSVATRKALLGLSVQDLHGLNGNDFERWVVAVLQAGGIHAQQTGRVGDYGTDVIATYRGRRLGIQVKRHSRAVGNSAVQQAIAGSQYYGCVRAAVVTQSCFTQAAIRQARGSRPTVILIDQSRLPRLSSIVIEALF